MGYRAMRMNCCFQLLSALALLGMEQQFSSAIDLPIVALTRHVSYALPDGSQSGDFRPPAINDAGQIAFYGKVSSDRTDTPEILWFKDTHSPLMPIAQEDFQVPTMPAGTVFRGFPDRVKLNNQGSLAFVGEFSATRNPIQQGIWTYSTNDGYREVLLAGASVPGSLSGETFGTFSNLKFNGAGEIAFSATLRGDSVSPANDFGIWSVNRDGTVRSVAREGDQAPGLPDGFRFLGFGSHVNENGRIAFSAPLSNPQGTSATGSSVWYEDPGQPLKLIARSGDHAPGLPEGFTFSNIGIAELNDLGDIAVEAGFRDPGRPNAYLRGLWVKKNDEALAPAYWNGMQVPEGPQGATFVEFSRVTLNAAGQLAFEGYVEIPGKPELKYNALFVEDAGGELREIVRSGARLPGLEGWRFDGIANLAINSAGQVAFVGEFGGDRANTGLWIADPSGNIRHIVHVGEKFSDPSTEQLRTFAWLFLGETGANSGPQSGFNNRGQVAFMSQVDDDDFGIFVTSLPIPEPNSAFYAIALAPAMLILARRTRNRRLHVD